MVKFVVDAPLWYDGEARAICVMAEVEGKRVRCAVAVAALQKLAGNGQFTKEAFFATFHANRSHLETIAGRVRQEGKTQRDGSILITAEILGR